MMSCCQNCCYYHHWMKILNLKKLLLLVDEPEEPPDEDDPDADEVLADLVFLVRPEGFCLGCAVASWCGSPAVLSIGACS
jgi:hypothetical protein